MPGGEELPPVVAEFEANASQFDSTVDDIEHRLEVLASINAEPHVGIDNSEFEDEVSSIETWLDYINEQSATATAYLETEEFQKRVAWAESLLDKIAATKATAEGDFDTARLQRQVEFAQGVLSLIEREYDARVEIPMADFQREYAEIEADIATLEAQSPVTIAVRFQEEGLNQIMADNEAFMQKTHDQLNFGLGPLTGDLAALAGGGDKGGGGGGAGLFAALGFGKNAAGGFGRFGGAGLAGFGTIGALAGLGMQSALTTGVALGGSLTGAALGGGALALGSAGVMGVGALTNMAGMGQAIGDVRQYNTALDQLNKALAVYGAGSRQAVAAQNNLNYVLSGFPAVAQGAIVKLSNATNAFHDAFNKATGPAEATGANILTQGVGVAQTFLPTIGKYAAENMKIIQAGMQPLFTWIQGPGLAVFKELEQVFQQHLPTAIHAFTQGIELLTRTLGFLAPQTGGFLKFMDDLLTKLNGPDFGKFTGYISEAIGVFRTWEGLIKAVGKAIYELFTHDAGTGTAIVSTLTDMINKFNTWAQGSGGTKLHAEMEAHKQELLSILGIVPHFLSAWGQIDVTVAPVLMRLVAGLADVAGILLRTPLLGQVLALGVAFEILGRHIGPLGTLMTNLVNDPLKKLMENFAHLAGDVMVKLGAAIGGVAEGPLTKLGTMLGNVGAPTGIEAAATSMSAAADSMALSSERIVAALESVGGAAEVMGGQVAGGTVVADGAMDTMAATATTDAAIVDRALASEGVSGIVGGAGAAGGAGVAAGGAEAAGAAGLGAGEAGLAAGGAGAAGAGLGASAILPAALAGVASFAITTQLLNSNVLGLGGDIHRLTGFLTGTDHPSTIGQGGTVELGPGTIKYLKDIASGKTPAPPGGPTPGQASSAVTAANAYTNVGGSPGLGTGGGGSTYGGSGGKGLPAGLGGSNTGPLAYLGTGGAPGGGGAGGHGPYDGYATTIKELSAATGLAAPNVKMLADQLKINLHGALDPGTIETFVNYVHQAGGAAAVTGQQWQTSASNIQVALQAMSNKAQTAMPNMSGSVRNMIVSTNPALVGLVSTMEQTGNRGPAAFISAYLSHLTPAQLASKNMHDKIHSPLLPLENELQAMGWKGPAGMIAAFIGQTPGASGASQKLHDSFANPLYKLQTDLASVGDIGGASLIQGFIKHHPEAATQSGLMHDAITGKLQPLEDGLKLIGDTSMANMIQSIATSGKNAAGAASGVGANIDGGIAAGIDQNVSVVTTAAGNVVHQGLAAANRTAIARSPSRLFADSTGKFIAQGMAVGITENAHLVTDAASWAVAKAQSVTAKMSAMTPADWQALSAAGALGGGDYLRALYAQQHPVPLPGATGAQVSVGDLHFHGDPSSIDPTAVGHAVADAVRIAQLRRSRTYGQRAGNMGSYAGSR